MDVESGKRWTSNKSAVCHGLPGKHKYMKDKEFPLD